MGAKGSRSSGSGFNQQASQDMSTAISRSMSENFQGGSDFSRTFVDPAQAAFNNQLNATAAGYGGRNAAEAEAASRAASAFLTPGLGQAVGSATALTNAQPQIASQEASLAAGLGRLFRNQMMPSIQSDAIQAGGLGGGRQGVAEANAIGQIADSYVQGLGDITARGNQQSLAAAAALPAIAQGFYGNALAPSMAAFAPLQAQREVMGAPTILSESGGTRYGYGRSDSNSLQQALGQSFGFGTNRQRAGSFGFNLI